MYKFYKYAITILLLSIITNLSLAQKTYLNSEWVTQTPQVGEGEYYSSSITISNQLIVASQILNGSGDSDIATIKYSVNGDTLWMNTYGGSANMDDFGTKIVANSIGDVITIGACQNTSGGYDYTILCYDATTGNTEWTYEWNGPTNGVDIPTDVTVDASNNVYVTGGTQDSYGYSNYATIKLSSSGTFQWASYYDYANLHDAAASIITNGSNVYVTGASAPSLGSWDVATLELLQSSGTLVNSQRSGGGATISEATSMCTDGSGNIYITGYALSGGNKNIQTIKLDSDLDLDWTQNFSGTLEDVGYDIGVDISGNVYIVGHTEVDTGKFKSIMIKYNSTGTEQWVRNYGNIDTENGAKGKKIEVLPSGDFYTTGNILKSDGNKTFFFNKFDSQGNYVTASKFESESIDNEAYDICIDGDDVYITGLSNTMGTLQTTIIKYTLGTRALNPSYYMGVATHVDDEIIFRFDESSMISSAINNKNLTFGTLSDFVNGSTISAMNSAYGNINWANAKTFKIFTNLTIADSISITRTGREMKMKPFWTMLLVEIPSSDERMLAELFETSAFPYVEAAQVNGLFELTEDADDTDYDEQHSLFSTTYPDAHINVEQAWDYEVGQPHVKVGVYDTGLKYGHEEFNGYVDSDGKLRGGKDYFTGGDITDIADEGDPITVSPSSGHGTRVGGIIGAFRNNETGIAGIAGGNWPHTPGEVIATDPDPSESQGVSMYGFKVITGPYIMDAATTASALIEGASNVSGSYGFGLHILNCSFRKNFDPLTDPESWDIIYDAQVHVFRNEVALIAAIGNDGEEFIPQPAYGKKKYWTIGVGGSNHLGRYHTSANFGDHIDLAAPYSTELVYTTSNDSEDDYENFNGTSSSAAHVSGVAALILSYYNSEDGSGGNLTPDDLEFLMNKYARDINITPATAGFDKFTGHGLLDAGEIFENIDREEYIIRHYYVDQILSATGSETATIKIDDGIHEPGIYTGTFKTVTYTNSHALNPGDIIINSWPLNSYTNTLEPPGASLFAREEYGMVLSSVGFSSATCSGRLVHVTEDPDGDPVDFWYPHSPTELTKFGYSLHIKTDYVDIDENQEELNFLCYPNPANSTLHLELNVNSKNDLNIRIFDIQGRLVNEKLNYQVAPGKQIINFDVSTFADGVYTIEIEMGNEIHNNKFIKK